MDKPRPTSRQARSAYERLFLALPDTVELHQPLALSYQGEEMHGEALNHFDALLAGWQNPVEGALPPPPNAETEIRIQAASSAAKITDYSRMHAYIDSLSDGTFNEQIVSGLVEISANTLMNEQKNYEEAVSVLDRVVERSPSAAICHYYRGRSHEQLGNFESAIADLGKFIDMSPTEMTEVKQAKDIIEQLSQSS